MKKLEKKNNWNLWDYIYYRTTLYYSKKEKKFGFEDNKRRGSSTVGLLLGLNIETLLMFVFALFFKKTTFLINYMGVGFIIVFLLIIFYSIYFFETKNHIQIFNKYKNEQTKNKKIREIVVVLYIVFTVVLLYAAVFFGRNFWKFT